MSKIWVLGANSLNNNSTFQEYIHEVFFYFFSLFVAPDLGVMNLNVAHICEDNFQHKSGIILKPIRWPHFFRLSCFLTILKVSSDTIIGWGATLIFKPSKMNFSEHPRAQWYMSKQFWRQINLQYNKGRFFKRL